MNFRPSSLVTRVEAWIGKEFWLDLAGYAAQHVKVSRRHLTRSQKLAGIQSAISLARNERNSAT